MSSRINPDAPNGMRAFGPLNVVAACLYIPLIPFLVGTPLVYVRLLSVAVTAVAVFSAVMMFRTKHPVVAWVYVAVAVLFNPLIVFEVRASAWTVAVIFAIVWSLFCAWRYRGPGIPEDHDEVPERFF